MRCPCDGDIVLATERKFYYGVKGDAMNKEEIAIVRQSIIDDYNSKINQLHSDMDTELQALARLEVRFTKISTDAETSKQQGTNKILIRRTRHHEDVGKHTVTSPSVAFKNALRKISGSFTRDEFHDRANLEADNPIKNGTFAPLFAGFVKHKAIIQVGQKTDSKALVYQKAEEVNKQAEPSQACIDGLNQ